MPGDKPVRQYAKYDESCAPCRASFAWALLLGCHIERAEQFATIQRITFWDGKDWRKVRVLMPFVLNPASMVNDQSETVYLLNEFMWREFGYQGTYRFETETVPTRMLRLYSAKPALAPLSKPCMRCNKPIPKNAMLSVCMECYDVIDRRERK